MRKNKPYVFWTTLPLLVGSAAIQLLCLEYEISKAASPAAGWIPTPSVLVVVICSFGVAAALLALAVAYWIVARRLDAPRLFWYSLGASLGSVILLWTLLGKRLPAILVP